MSAGIWERLGFRENPYFSTPIGLSDEGRNLFVGRAVDLRRMINKWSSEKEGAITIISGNIGTGKTSFLNVCQFLCLTGVKDFQLPFEPPLLLPAVERVQIETDQTDASFLVKVIRATAASIAWSCNFISESVPELVKETLSWLDSPVQSNSSSAGGGLTLPIVLGGGGFQGTRTVASSTRQAVDMPIEVLVAKLRDLAACARKIRKYSGVIVAVDNLEMIEPEKAISLLNKYRDTMFALPHIWWVLIGQKGLYDLIEAEAPRVAQRIKGTEALLEGLSWEDFLLATQVRLEHFKLRADAVPPVDEELLRALFDASSGEIRYIFKIADQIVVDAIAEAPDAVSVPPALATRLLKDSVSDQLRRLSLSDREVRVIKMLCDKKVARPKEYKEFGFKNTPHFLQAALQPLQEKGLVSRSTEGNAALYTPRAPAILAYKFDLYPASRTAGVI